MADTALVSITSFGEMLKYLRRRAGMTLRELGLATGYSESLISKLERGQRLPDPFVVKTQFLTALGLRTETEFATHLIDLAITAHGTDGGQMLTSISSGLAQKQHRTNIQPQLSPFIGRRSEVGEVMSVLTNNRLVTLTGAGGVGKTRLALEVASSLLSEYANGIWLVELAPILDAKTVPQAIAAAFNLQDMHGQAPIDILKTFLKDKQLLLVLDNCEHLLDACAECAEALLRACPGLRVMITSREPLRLPGEIVWRVPSLETPDPLHLPLLARMRDYDAIELFVRVASTAYPDFMLTTDNMAAVAQICHHLDGIPLAIEMAAVLVDSLSVAEIAAGLAGGLALLTSGSRAALPRYRTLRATLDWSYSLLNESERALLARLSVFAGGWTAEAAQAVCGDAPLMPQDCLPTLLQLARKSLVTATMHNHHTRYHLLETIRQYAAEKLHERGETNQTRERHLQRYLALVEETMDPSGRIRKEWLSRVDPEHNNLRAAFNWARERADTDAGEMMLRVAGGMRPYHLRHGFYDEGLAWLEEALARGVGAPAHARAKALLALATIRKETIRGEPGNVSAALRIFETALALFQESNDAIGSAWCLEAMAYIQLSYLEKDDSLILLAQKNATQALANFRAADCRAGIIRCLHDLGRVALDTHQPKQARAYADEALRMALQMDDLVGLSGVMYLSFRLDYQLGMECYNQAIQLCQQLGDVQQLALFHHHAGDEFQEHNDYLNAASAYKECISLLRQTGIPQGDFDSQNYLAWGYFWLGIITQIQGNTEEAISHLVQAGNVAQLISLNVVADSALYLRGMLMLHQGHPREAEAALSESLRSIHQYAPVGGEAYNFRSMIALERVKGCWSRAARLMGVYDTQASLNQAISPTNCTVLFMETIERELADPHAQLGDAAYEAEYAVGQKMTVDEAVAYALEA